MNAMVKPRKRTQRNYPFTVRRLMDPATGEVVGALVPRGREANRAMREAKYTVGTELSAILRKSRNYQFWKLAHVLGGWLSDNVDGFTGLGMHAALKKLQEDSGVGCIVETFDLGSLGKVSRTVAESLNFEDMDEGRFSELWDGGNGEGGWIGWLRREKWVGLDRAQLEEVERLITGEGM